MKRLIDIKLLSTVFFSLVVLSFLVSCKSKRNTASWKRYIPGVGTGSSARAVDLNRDGVADIVIGAGGRENNVTDTAVVALNGVDGEMLWKVAGINQMIGSAGFLDINNDSIPDVFIGGRSAQLLAIDGSTGNVLWSFSEVNTSAKNLPRYAFYNPQFVMDQNMDGYSDILIANGGNNFAEPYDTNRPAGQLLIISSKNGKIIANALVPDGKETYMSPVCLNNSDKNPTIYFGTGGETIGGNFYRTTLQDVLNENLSDAVLLAQAKFKGFVAPPVLVDINDDKKKDVIVNSVDGRLIAIDGSTDSILWNASLEGSEAYSTPSVGYYNEDKIPDFFCTYGLGVWPDISKSVHFMVDGKSGRIEFTDYQGGFQYASPLTVDFDGDGQDEVLVSINERKDYPQKSFSYLLAYNFKDSSELIIGDTLVGNSVASTPFVGDLDKNGFYDIFYTSIYFTNFHNDIDNPTGLQMALFKTKYKIFSPIKWGAYMGSKYDGNF